MSDQDDSSLPHNWARSELGDLVEVLRGVTYNRGDARSEPAAGLIPILRATNIADRLIFSELVYVPKRCVSEEQLLHPGDLVVVASSGSRHAVGRAAFLANPWRGSFGAFCFALRPSPEVNSRFLALFLQTPDYRRRISELSAGININNLKAEHLKRMTIVLAPRREQDRIVAEVEKHLTRLDVATNLLRRIQANMKRYRAAVLKAACEGRLVPPEAEQARAAGHAYDTAPDLLGRILNERRGAHTGSRRYKEPRSIDPEGLPALPEGWIWASVDSLSNKVVDGVHKKPNYVSNGVPFVTVKNLTAGSAIDFQRLNYISEEDHRNFTRRSHPEKGDLLISKDGTLGVVRAIRTDREFSIFVSVALVKPVVREMTDYLEIALSSPQVQAQMVPKGSGLQHIHLEDLREDCIPLPPPAEQERIVIEVHRRLSLVENLSDVVAQSLARARSLRQGILRAAFEGSLVAQDLADEPASELLARVRCNKEDHVKCRSQNAIQQIALPRASEVEGHIGEEERAEFPGAVSVGMATHASLPLPSTVNVSDSPAKEAAALKSRRAGKSRLRHSRAARQESVPAALKNRRTGRRPVESFAELPSEEQVDAVWKSLFGLGTLERDEAVRMAAEALRGGGLAQFQRLRRGGALYDAIEEALARGLRAGDFDRLHRGHVRAILRDPRDYPSETWRFCLLESFDHQVLERGEALRAAAVWARENLGLEYGRLREDGIILRGLREALKQAIRRGELGRVGKDRVRRAGRT